MFKKFKDKLAEEMKQSPARLQAGMQQLAQVVASPSLSSGSTQDLSSSRDNFSLTDEMDDTPRNSPGKHGFQTVELTPPSVNSSSSRRSSLSSNVSEASFLFPVYESPGSIYQLQPDIDQSINEVDENISPQLDQVSKEQLYAAYSRARTKYDKYKERFTDLANHYREIERAKSKLESLLVETQDKALRRISDLKEQCQLEQQAKAHLEDALRNDLEEKDHVINSLRTKIKLLQEKGLSSETLDGTETAESHNGNKIDELVNLSPDAITEESRDLSTLSAENVQMREKLQKLESLVEKYKDMLKRNKDKVLEITNEKTTLERDYDLLQKSSKGKLEDVERELCDARDKYMKLKDEVDILKKREEESAISLAENKLSIHRELEHKEEQIKQLQLELKQARDSVTNSQKSVESLKHELEKMKSISDQNAKANQELLRSKSEAVKQLQNEMQQKLLELEEKMGSKYHEEVNKNKELLSKLEELGKLSESSKNETKSIQDLSKELQEKVNLIEELQNRRETYEKQLEEQKMTNSSLEKELLETKSCLDSSRNDSTSDSNYISQDDKEKVVNLENLLKEKDQVCNQLTAQIEGSTRALEEMRCRMKLQSEKLRSLENQATNEETSGLREELDNKDVEILGLSREVKSHLATINDLKEEIRNHVTFRKNINKYLRTCKKSLKNLKQDHICLKSQVSDRILDGKRAILEVIGQTNESCSYINDSCVTLQTRIADLAKQTQMLEDFESRSEENKIELERISNEKHTLESELKEKCAEIDELKSKYNELNELTFKNQKLLQEIEHLTLQLKDANMLSAEKEKLLQESYSEKEIILKNMSLESRKNEIVINELKSQLSEKASIVEEYNKLLQRHEESVNIIASLKSENEDRSNLLEKIQTLNSQLESSKEGSDRKTKELERLQSKILEITQQSSKIQLDRDNQKKLLQEHQEQISLLAGELESVKSAHLETINEMDLTKNLLLQEKESSINVSKKVESLEVELQNTLLAKKTLESNFEQVQLKLQNIQTEQDSMIKKRAEEVEELLKSNSSLKSDITVLEANKNDLTVLQNENLNLSTGLNELKILLDTQEQENKALKQQQDDVLKANDALSQSQNQLTQKLRGLEKEQRSLANENSNLLKEVDSYRHQLEEATLRIRTQSDEIHNLDQLKSRIVELENQALKANENREQNVNLDTKIQELAKHNEFLATQVESLQDELSRTRESRTNDLECELEKFEGKIGDLQTRLSTKDMELQTIKSESEKEMQSLRERLEEKVDELNRQKAEVLELTSSRRTLEDQTSTQIHDWQEKVGTMKEQLSTKDAELNNLREKCFELEKEVASSISNKNEDEQVRSNLECLSAEKRQLESQLNEIFLTSQAKENQMQLLVDDLRAEILKLREQIKVGDEEHNLRLKQIVKEFQAQLSDKERELQAALDRRFDDQQSYESDTLQEYKEQLKDFQIELTRKSQEIEKLILDNEKVKSEKQNEIDELSRIVDQLKSENKKKMQELESKWKAIIEQKTSQLDNRHQSEIVKLTNEWQSEKRSDEYPDSSNSEELESTTKVAMAAVQSNTGSFHTLQQTLSSQKKELTELRKLVKMRQESVEDSTEIEYLRNILYKYMMGKETMVLARVIAAVVKFDQEQTATILKKEEDKLSLLGSLGLT